MVVASGDTSLLKDPPTVDIWVHAASHWAFSSSPGHPVLQVGKGVSQLGDVKPGSHWFPISLMFIAANCCVELSPALENCLKTVWMEHPHAGRL